jgi:hypothetical protein
MAKTLASAALLSLTELDVLANVAYPVEKQYLGVPQVTSDRADEGDDHGGGCLALSILVGGDGGEPSRRRGQLCGWAVHLDLFAGILWGGGGVDPVERRRQTKSRRKWRSIKEV